MGDVQKHIVKQGKRSTLSRPFYTRSNEEAIAAWKLEFDRIRHVLEVHFFTCFSG